MTWTVPTELEDAVLAAARDVVGDAPLAAKALHRAVVDRSARYTSERDRLGSPADRTADLAARAAFFTIADAIKIAIPIGELSGRGALPARRPLRVVDLGAGCGALGLGLVETLRCELDLVAIDRDVDALRIAGGAIRRLAAHHGVTAHVTTRAADVSATAIPPADLVIAGNLLNELAETERVALVERMLAAIGDDGAVIVVEPALRETARSLHAVRDAILTRGLGHVFAPCTRLGAPCPALADPDDWCHEDRLVSLPPRTAELARVTHLRDGGLKFAYLVLRRTTLPLVEASGAWRVVSAPHSPKGKLELYGCGDPGRVPIRLLRRHRAEANRPIERTRRGDVLVIDGTPDDTRLEVTADNRVERIEPAGR
jgi:ribosomal protein RSM22 (predicted rRNA methylase)